MIHSIDEALRKADELVIDDCANLYWVFKYNSEELKKFNAELKLKEKDKEGFYFKGDKYHFYSPADVSELIDFMMSENRFSEHPKTDSSFLVLKNDKMLPDKIIMNADPRNYFSTVCIDYGTEQVSGKASDKNKNKQPG